LLGSVCIRHFFLGGDFFYLTLRGRLFRRIALSEKWGFVVDCGAQSIANPGDEPLTHTHSGRTRSDT
jgi:hypothetical protein